MKKRNNRRILLPHGNSCSALTVHPANWQTEKASIKKPWWISYRFYMGDQSVQRVIRGMNTFDVLIERQVVTRQFLADEMELLKEEGYNPILDKSVPPVTDDDMDYVISPGTPLSQALSLALDHYEGVPKAKKDLKSSLSFLQKSIRALGFQDRPVKDVARRHLLRILENCSNIKKGFTNNQYNHYRGALSSLFRILLNFDTVEANYVKLIEKKQHAPEPRQILTAEQRIALDQRLKIENYRFWNFIHLFFHSGARLAEMARVQGKHVDLERQSVLYYVKKRQVWAWVPRPISDEALPFWERAMKGCLPKQYVFAKNLLPGDKPIAPEQYTRRWYRWVKKPLKDEPAKWGKKRERDMWLNVDMYELKHTHTTMVIDALEGAGEKEAEQTAAKMNGHTSTAMVKGVYDVKNKTRKDDKIKSLPIRLA